MGSPNSPFHCLPGLVSQSRLSWYSPTTALHLIYLSHLSFTPLKLITMAENNDAQHEHTFESADAGASATFPMQCSALRKNGFVVIKNRPCKIVDMSTSKTGKHGHAEVHLVAIDIFTNKKLEDLSPSTHNMDVPNVVRVEYQLVNIDDGFLNLMTNEGVSKDDVKVPEGEVGDQIQQMFDDGKDVLVTIVSAMGEEHALAVKEAPTGGK